MKTDSNKLILKILKATRELLSKYSIPRKSVELAKLQLDSFMMKELINHLNKSLPKEKQVNLEKLSLEVQKESNDVENQIKTIRKNISEDTLYKSLISFTDDILPNLLKEFDNALKEYLEKVEL